WQHLCSLSYWWGGATYVICHELQCRAVWCLIYPHECTDTHLLILVVSSVNVRIIQSNYAVRPSSATSNISTQLAAVSHFTTGSYICLPCPNLIHCFLPGVQPLLKIEII